jgi:hypothetical protein
MVFREAIQQKRKIKFSQNKNTQKPIQAISGDSEVERFKFINIKEKLP